MACERVWTRLIVQENAYPPPALPTVVALLAARTVRDGKSDMLSFSAHLDLDVVFGAPFLLRRVCFAKGVREVPER